LRTRADRNRFVLRAELHRGNESAISYAFDLTPQSAFVATEWTATIGEPIALQLSFPRLLEPVHLEAGVDELCAPSGPGAPPGLLLRFEPDPRMTELLERAKNDDAAPLGTTRILLVEDNDLIRDLFEYGLRAFFATRGVYAVDQAASAETAWEQLGGATYDVAIVDHFLPADSGADLIRRMRSEPRLSGLPIVAVSVGGSDARDACLDAGADLFLDKPVVFRDLFNTLRIMGAAP
jgi:CheY-like chemotaxis protein